MRDDDQGTNELLLAILDRGRSLGIDTLGKEQRVVFLILELMTYTEMEGLAGFYSGMEGEEALEVIAALRLIGATHSADLIQRANALFPAGRPPAARDELDRALNALDHATFDAIHELGLSFVTDRPDRWDELLDQYITNHRKALACGIPSSEA